MNRGDMELVVVDEYRRVADRADKLEKEFNKAKRGDNPARTDLIGRHLAETVAQAYMLEKVLLRSFGREESRQVVRSLRGGDGPGL